ncbi:MAG: HD-GYP domain-containing protein [Phycisphaerae bacterium]
MFSLSAYSSADPVHTSSIVRQFRQLADANEALRRELSRCYERLNVVREISENCSTCDDPATLRAALLNRYADTLDAARLLLDHDNRCAPVRAGETSAGPRAVVPSRVRARLAREIEDVRRTRRACRLNLPEASQRGLGEIHLLLSTLEIDSEQPHVVIALRPGGQAPFDEDDQSASETVLTYGGHILRNVQMVQRLRQASLETVGALANAIEARDYYTGGHSERVGWLAVLTGKALRLPAGDLQMLEWSGLLHDVGKIGIPEHVLNKPGELTAEESEQIRQHPRLGYEVLRPVSSLKPVCDAVLYHHENHDGSGYPEGLRGEQIPLSARILHVVDIFDALTSTRSYRAGLGVDKALEVLAVGAQRITDPAATTTFINAFRHYMQAQPDDFKQRFARL